MIIDVPELHIQPDFPRVDLTEPNKRATSLMLSIRTLVDCMHSGLESVAPTFGGIHRAITDRFLFMDNKGLSAVDYGVTLLESTLAVVGASTPQEIGPVNVSLALIDRRIIDSIIEPRVLSEMDVKTILLSPYQIQRR